MRVYRRKYKGPDGAEKLGKTYWALYYVGGKRFHESLGTHDKRAAELIANERLRREELRRAGIEDPFERSHEKTLDDHLADFEKTLRARGVVSRYVADRLKCLRDFFAGAGARTVTRTDRRTATRQLGRQYPRALARPAQTGHWVAARARLDQVLQPVGERGIQVPCTLAPAPGSSNAAFFERDTVLHVPDAARDRRAGDLRGSHNRGDPAATQRQGLGRSEDALAALIQHGAQHAVARSNGLDVVARGHAP